MTYPTFHLFFRHTKIRGLRTSIPGRGSNHGWQNILYEILSHGGKDIQKDAAFYADAAVLHAI